MAASSTTKYWSKNVPEQSWDYIVIGSGMGGMTAAAMLAKMGRTVLVIEQHYEPGGFTHTFKRPHYRWDVGVHAVGEVTDHTMTGRLLAYLTDQSLEWASLGATYDEFLFPDGFRIDFPNNPSRFRANLVAAFPDETKAIDRYFDLVREVTAGMRTYYLSRALPKALSGLADQLITRRTQEFLEMNTEEVVSGLTENVRLQTVLTAQWGYYGSIPSRSSFAMQALVTKHFMHGGYYPVGGSREIARGLLRTVANAGGWTCIATGVEEILIEKNRAVGIRLENGKLIHAKKIVSAAGILSTATRLLPEAYHQQEWVKSVETLPPAPCHVCLYLGFKGNIRRAGAGSANNWFYSTWLTRDNAWRVTVEDELSDAPILYVSFPSLKDPAHDPGPEERHTGEIVTFVPWQVFEQWQGTRWKKRGDSYEDFKGKLQKKLLKQFLQHMPDLEPMIDFAELSTPLTTDHFCRPVKGSIYGLEPTPERFKNPWLRPRSPIPGLYFAGGEVTSVGVIGAMMGGVLSVVAAEPLRSLKILRGI